MDPEHRTTKQTKQFLLWTSKKNGSRGGGRKEDRMAFVHSNDAILKMCNTMKMDAFIASQQKRFLAHIIRREDCLLIKQLTFNSDSVRKRGRFMTLRKAVLQREGVEPNKFYKDAIMRKI